MAATIRWQGATRAAALCMHLTRDLRGWHAGWLGGTRPAAQLRRLELEMLPETAGAWWVVGDECPLYVAASEDAPLALGRYALGLEPTVEAEFAAKVGADGFGDLCRSLWGGDAATADIGVVRAREAEAYRLQERFGCLGFVLEGLPFRMWLGGSHAWCERFGPQRAPATGLPPLLPRKHAIAALKVEVRARVRLGEIALHEPLDWSEDEVLVTDASSRARVEMVVGDRIFAGGMLAADGRRRAVALQAVGDTRKRE